MALAWDCGSQFATPSVPCGGHYSIYQVGTGSFSETRHIDEAESVKGGWLRVALVSGRPIFQKGRRSDHRGDRGIFARHSAWAVPARARCKRTTPAPRETPSDTGWKRAGRHESPEPLDRGNI